MNKINLRLGSLGLIIPCFNEQSNIVPLLIKIASIAKDNNINIYPIVIDDGSNDDTFNISLNCLKENFKNGFALKRFIRNFGKESAILAGLRQSNIYKCDCTALIDADFQDDPESLIDMYEKWQEGYQLVSCIREKRYKVDPLLKRLSSYLFYVVFEMSSKFKYRKGIGDFRLMDKSVVSYLLLIPERIRFFKGLVSWIGVDSTYVVSARKLRKTGRSKWNAWKLWNYALDGIFNHSTSPIRIWTYFGLLIIFSGLIYLLMSLILTYAGVFVIQPGYFSIISLIIFFGGLNMIGIGLLGEYIGRIFIEVKQRPEYIIREEVLCDESSSTVNE